MNTAIKSGLMFLLLGLPGLVLFLVSIGALLLGALGPHAEGVWALGGAAGIALALPMTLAGVGLWGRWRYLWVFAVLPVAFAAAFVPVLLLAPQGKDGFLVAAFTAAFFAIVTALLVVRAVRASYAGAAR